MYHNSVIAISALFLLVFAVIIQSMRQHRSASGQTSSRFGGPTGRSQWIWATIPLLILALVNIALFRGDDRHETTLKPTAATVTESPVKTHTARTATSLNVALVSSPMVRQ